MNTRLHSLAPALVTAALCSLPFALDRRAEAASPEAGSPPVEYSIDAGHSQALFRVKHSGVAWFWGRFNTVNGTVHLDDEDLTKSSVSIEIPVDSIDTGMEKLDNHLKSGDFFAAEEFPKMTFESVETRKVEGDTYAVVGDLTIHGVTKEVTLDVTITGRGKGRRGPVAGFEATLDIKRSDYGVSYMVGEMLGDEVRLLVSLECGAR